MPGLADEVRRHRKSGQEALIYWHESIDSTNDEAFRLWAKERVPEGTVVISDTQTKGKGRSGRAWFSPPGVGLYLSVLLTPPAQVFTPSPLTLLAGVAVASALERLTGRAPQLKWPNDLQYDGLKVGGILTEAQANRDQISGIVIGIGLNLSQLPEDFPPDLREGATSVLSATGHKADRTELAAAILDELDTEYRKWLQEGFEPAAEAWRQRTSTLGKRVRIVLDDVVTVGLAKTIGEDGSLVIQTATGITRIQAGEVTEIESE
jgi:BirA family biotin operon repressor/biotin-[acetyl-CoA-carboxylase] ligase